MRAVALLCLLLVLVACAAPRPPTGRPGGASTPVAAPVADQALAASVPLSIWNETERHREVRLIDSTSGQDLPAFSPIIGQPLAYSTDRRVLVVHEPHGQSCEPSAGGTACRPGAGVLHVVDLTTWQSAEVALPPGGWVGPVAFSPATALTPVAAVERHDADGLGRLPPVPGDEDAVVTRGHSRG